MEKKYLSSIANDVVQRCASELDSSVVALYEEFDAAWKPELSNYSRKLVEFCCSKALNKFCCKIGKTINDGSFSRLTFDMMLAWEKPSFTDEDRFAEFIGKGKEDKKAEANILEEHEDVSLFYSNIMPLLVGNEPSIGEYAFTWMISVVPLMGDSANAQSTFETLTMSTGLRLHFPGYGMFIKEIDRCIKDLQKHRIPGGVELAEDEFILHVDGTPSTQRVVRHIGGTSWPGRLTLTNYAFYFEASGVVSYENAVKVSLSKANEQSVKTASTGPWGAPLHDKAILYESSEMEEGIVLEFPELTSSTRRDNWLALMNEIIFMHEFLKNYKVKEAWEMQARTMLGIIRLHAAREMMKMSPPIPTSFLIFSLYEEMPKGDYVLEKLAESVNLNTCSAAAIFKSLVHPHLNIEAKSSEEAGERVCSDETSTSLQTAIDQCRVEAREINRARATTESVKEEGILESVLVLMELLGPVRRTLQWLGEIFNWKRPVVCLCVLMLLEIVAYKQWVGKGIALLILWLVMRMLWVRRYNKGCAKVVVRKGSDKTTMESLVSAQHGLRAAHSALRHINVTILKIRSILLYRTAKHSNVVMMAMVGLAVLLAVVPLRFIVMVVVVAHFVGASELGKGSRSRRGERRISEWWDGIPVDPVETVDQPFERP